MVDLANTVCQQVLDQLKCSNLNFIISETPYSAQIMLKKRFLREVSGPSASFNSSVDHNASEKLHALNQENIDLKEKVRILELAQTSGQETIKILEEKVAKAEASALKHFEKTKLETACLKTSIKNLKNDLDVCKKELNDKNKVIKQKEKEVQKLDKKCDNLTCDIQNMRRELKSFKSERNNAEELEKKNEFSKLKGVTEFNNNEKKDENVFDIKPSPLVSTTLSASETTSSRPPRPESPRTPQSTLPENSEELLSPTSRFSLTCHKLIKLIEDRETDEATEEVT